MKRNAINIIVLLLFSATSLFAQQDDADSMVPPVVNEEPTVQNDDSPTDNIEVTTDEVSQSPTETSAEPEEEEVTSEEDEPDEEDAQPYPKDDAEGKNPSKERPTRESRYDENIYMKGDLNAQIKLGIFLPAYIHSFGFGSIGKFQLSPGLMLGVGIDAYLNNNVKLGGELSFSTSTGINGGRAFFVPIVFRAFYEFHVYSWSFPVGGSVGINIASYKGDMTAISLIFRPEVGAIYQITKNWGVGLVTTWAIAPQIVWKDLPKSRVGNSFEVALLGQYHF